MRNVLTRWWDHIAVAVFVMMAYSAAARLSATEWTPDLAQVEAATLLGALLGLALGYSRFERRHVLILTGGYSAVILPWLLSLIIRGEQQIQLRLVSLSGRFVFSFGQLLEQKPVEDPLFFVVLMSILFWSISLASGYFLLRYSNSLAAIIPSGVGVIIIQFYDHDSAGRIFFVALYFFLSLVLLGRMFYLQNRTAWQEGRVHANPEIGFDLIGGTLAGALAVVLLAWAMPAYGQSLDPVREAWQKVTEPFDSTRQGLEDALAALRGSQGKGMNLFGDSLNLGRSAVTGTQTMFTVTAPAESSTRYYWRARVYDTYTNNSWGNLRTATRSVSPGTAAYPLPDGADRFDTTFTFSVTSAQDNLITGLDPVAVSRAVEVIFAGAPFGTVDLLGMKAGEPIRPGEKYQARSSLHNPSISSLRAAGEAYPDWVQERYLQLPEDFSPRIAALAAEIAAPFDNPYDKVEAVTAYLRENIAYAETVDLPAQVNDPLEWVLMSGKQGFCNYYASAEVLMLRSLGIPARMAVGYAQGLANESEADESVVYVVQLKDAHAWPEVYFPEIGWVQFEPTSIQEPLERPLEADAGPDALPGALATATAQPGGPGTETQPEQGGGGLSRQVVTGILWVIITSAVLLGSWWLVRISRRTALPRRAARRLRDYYARRGAALPDWLDYLALWAEKSATERAYESINQSLHWLGQPAPRHSTAAERSAQLIRLVPDAAGDIRELTRRHEEALFSRRRAEAGPVGRIGWIIRLKALRALLQRFI